MGRRRVANTGTVEAGGCSRLRETPFRRISKDLGQIPFQRRQKMDVAVDQIIALGVAYV
jgi:hypothetical protein